MVQLLMKSCQMRGEDEDEAVLQEAQEALLSEVQHHLAQQPPQPTVQPSASPDQRAHISLYCESLSEETMVDEWRHVNSARIAGQSMASCGTLCASCSCS